MNDSKYNVLHGPLGSAGQPGLLARTLREQGVKAQSFMVGPNKFGYETDDHTPVRTNSTMRQALARKLPEADILHIHAITPLFVKGRFRFPMGTDLLLAKAAGKRVIMHFRGSEVRIAEIFRERSPFHYADEDHSTWTNFPAEWQQQYIQMCRALCDEILVNDPELLSYVPGATILPRAIDIQKWSNVGLVNPSRPKIVHAPSRQGIKGTSHVLAAIETLKAEGLDFDFQLVEGLPNDEARRIYEGADIIVDQLRIGWYGVLATEAMALGKVCVSYVRSDLIHHLGDNPPIAVADPITITDVLRRLILSPQEMEHFSQRGREFCESYHSADVVALKCREIYDRVWANPRVIDIPGYLAINEYQEAQGSPPAKVAVAAKNAPGKPAGESARKRLHWYARALLQDIREGNYQRLAQRVRKRFLY